VSGEEFVARWESGQYKGPDAEPGRMSVVMLLPFARSREARRRVLAARTEHEAIRRSRESPCTDALLPRKRHLRGVKGRYYTSATPHPLTLMDGLPVELGSDTGLTVQVSQRYG
jgi:hypothetical protein